MKQLQRETEKPAKETAVLYKTLPLTLRRLLGRRPRRSLGWWGSNTPSCPPTKPEQFAASISGTNEHTHQEGTHDALLFLASARLLACPERSLFRDVCRLPLHKVPPGDLAEGLRTQEHRKKCCPQALSESTLQGSSAQGHFRLGIPQIQGLDAARALHRWFNGRQALRAPPSS